MLRSCKAGSLVQVQVRAPIRSLRSFTDLVCRRRQDRSPQRAPCAGSPIGRRHLAQNESSASSNLAWRTIRPRSPIGRGPALNAGQCRFEACRGYAPVAQSAEAAVSRAACCRFEPCAAHHWYETGTSNSVGSASVHQGWTAIQPSRGTRLIGLYRFASEGCDRSE
jgi:hypothetical protein